MIDAKDLMIGNWLYDKVLEKPIQFNNLPYGIDLSNREGIEVTEEMLEKIGFEKNTELGDFYTFWRYWDKDNRYKLETRRGEDWCNSMRKFDLHVDNDHCNTIGAGEFTYLHELQNLTRTISGHGLTITKEMLYDEKIHGSSAD